MDNEERFNLIKRNTVEILVESELKALLDSGKSMSAYIGRATTGALHLGHLIALSKLVDLSKAGVGIKVLLADIHSVLDDQKSRWEQLDLRVEYTKKCIELAFNWEKQPEFIRGSDYQLRKEYVLDMLKVSTITTVDRAMRAASEVTRMKNPKVSELIYPLMQALDEEYLDVDIQLGGLDQRHILALAREVLPMIGYKKRIEVMTPLVASMRGPGTKMSSSVPESNIKIYDSEDAIKRKINSAYCPEGVVQDNPILQIVKFMILPADGKFRIERDEKFGGDLEIADYNELEKLFSEKKLHPADLKAAVTRYLVNRFKFARQYFENNLDLLKELGNEFLPS
ncbi:MAG: tyrosine--tRNA ligase [Candidatus Parvarchaeota archaeon]|jgi:tyrosyl-tRNA synthetase|nr:tyrosine--tRNA ligase [Candidatus Parvarchaeota archaeon]